MKNKRISSILITFLGILIISSTLPSVSSAEYIDVKRVEAPPSVEAGSSFTVQVTVEYSFKGAATIMVMIWDLEKNFLASGDEYSGSWILEEVSQTGSKTYSIEVTAVDVEKTWNLLAVAQYYTVADEWVQSEGWRYDFTIEVVTNKPEIWVRSQSLVEEELGLDLEEELTYPGDTISVTVEIENTGSVTAKQIYFAVEDLTPHAGIRVVEVDPPQDLNPGETRIWRVKLKVEEVAEYKGYMRLYVEDEMVIEADLLLPVSEVPLNMKSFESTHGEDEPIYPEDTVTAKYQIENLGDRPIRQIDLQVHVDSEELTLLEQTSVKRLEAKQTGEWLVRIRGEKEGEYIMRVDLYAQGVEVLEEWHILSVHISSKPWFQCMIATATYGSELSPEVNFLRGFRDDNVMKTFAGSQFISIFNRWYYSFSPHVAYFIGEHSIARDAMKITLYPLFKILQLSAESFSFLSFNQEVAVVVAGLTASTLIGIIYVVPLIFMPLHLLQRYRPHRSLVKLILPFWGIGFLLIIVGEISKLQHVMMMGTAVFVLSTITLSSLAIIEGISKITKEKYCKMK